MVYTYFPTQKTRGIVRNVLSQPENTQFSMTIFKTLSIISLSPSSSETHVFRVSKANVAVKLNKLCEWSELMNQK